MRLHLFYLLLFFLGMCTQGVYASDEIISYEHLLGKTEFIFYQHDGTALTREGDATHITQTTGWLTGDADGDGVDELISKEHVGGRTEFVFYQHDGSSFTREGDATHTTQTTGWLVADTDGDGVDEIITYDHSTSKTEFVFYHHDGTSFIREGDATHFTQTTGWLACDTDGDGIAEIISYDEQAGKTEFIFYSHDGSSFTRESAHTHFTKTSGWLTGDADGDGVDELISYDFSVFSGEKAGKTQFVSYQYNETRLVREGDATHTFNVNGWLVADTDEALTLLSYSPENTTLRPEEGENITFSIDAEQSDGASLSYAWQLDRHVKATSSEWTLATGLEAPGQHNVSGSATDGKLAVSKEWTVEIAEPEKPDELPEQPDKEPEIIDKSPPEIELTSPAPGVVDGAVRVEWTASDKVGRVIEVTLSVSGDGGAAWTTIASRSGDGGVTWDSTGVPDGDYTLKITAESRVGKSEETVLITVDNPDMGTIYVSSNPGEADIIIDGETIGKTSREIEIPAGFYEIEIKKEGYSLWAKWMEVKEGENPTLRVRLIPMIFGLTPVQLMIYALSGIFTLVIVFLLIKIFR
jgi:hypothetical protein